MFGREIPALSRPRLEEPRATSPSPSLRTANERHRQNDEPADSTCRHESRGRAAAAQAVNEASRIRANLGDKLMRLSAGDRLEQHPKPDASPDRSNRNPERYDRQAAVISPPHRADVIRASFHRPPDSRGEESLADAPFCVHIRSRQRGVERCARRLRLGRAGGRSEKGRGGHETQHGNRGESAQCTPEPTAASFAKGQRRRTTPRVFGTRTSYVATASSSATFASASAPKRSTSSRARFLGSVVSSVVDIGASSCFMRSRVETRLR